MNEQGILNGELTPMLRQYFDLQVKVSDAILFFRMGDFYEVFGSNAEVIAPILDIVLTSREKGDQTKIPFCGVPHHSAQTYFSKLLNSGYKLAIAEQMEESGQGKGLLKREIVKILTPGCRESFEGSATRENNFMCAIYEDPSSRKFAFAAVDISTGEFRLGEVQESNILDIVFRFSPKQILARNFFIERLKESLKPYLQYAPVFFDLLPEAPLQDKSLQTHTLRQSFGVDDLSQLPCKTIVGGSALVSSILKYLESLRIETTCLRTIEPLLIPDTTALSEVTMRDLELFETARRRQREGSLMSWLDQTRTPMGSRRLRDWLASPLINRERIQQRHRLTHDLKSLGFDKLSKLRSELHCFGDLRRIATRIATKKAVPKELWHLRTVLHSILTWSDRFGDLKNFEEIVTIAEELRPLALELERCILEQPSDLGQGGGVLRTGLHTDYDHVCDLVNNGTSKVVAYEESLRQITGITSLKIKSHQSFGRLIEVTKSHLSKVPENFIRRQTMVNCERFVTTALVDLDAELNQAIDRSILLEAQIYQNILERVFVNVERLFQLSDFVAELDCLACFAYLAIKNKLVCPELSTDSLKLKGSRHPVVEGLVGRHNFTPNDFNLSESICFLLITGPNMGGKSTAMRQVAICAILNQIGCFVPAEVAQLPVFDHFFTRIGASDDLSLGQSTFMVEMTEAAHILRRATRRSLVVIDEIGRGTSSADGFALACAILEYLANHIGCMTMFATHFHEIIPIAQQSPKISFVQTEALRENVSIRFTHRIVSGFADRSYGIEVAQLAGVPMVVLESAQKFMDSTKPESALSKSTNQKRGISKIQKELFALSESLGGADSLVSTNDWRLAKITALLERINIHKTTPLQALNHLNNIKSLAFSPKQPSLFDGIIAEEENPPNIF